MEAFGPQEMPPAYLKSDDLAANLPGRGYYYILLKFEDDKRKFWSSSTLIKASESQVISKDQCHSDDLIIQKGNRGESAAVEKLMEAKGNYGATSSIVSVAVTSSSEDMNQSNLISTDGVSCTGFAQSETDKRESLKATVVENVPHSHSKVLPMSMYPRVDDVSNEGASSTFDVRPLAVYSKGGEGSLPTSGQDQLTTKVVQENSHGSPLQSDVATPSADLKSPSACKTRYSSGKSAKSGKEIKAARGTSQLVQFGIQNVESSTSKTSGIVSSPAPGLPDLNSSAPVSALFHQPSADLERVQLRAQIVVSESVVQGTSPDEASMVSAFGISDGGRSIWQPCVERIHGQKSQGDNSEMPIQSCSGGKPPDQASKRCIARNKVITSPASRSSSMFAPSPMVYSMAPLSSHAPPIPIANTMASSVLAGTPSLIDTTVVTVLSGQNSADTRKRKETSGAKDFVQSRIPAPMDPVFAPIINSHLLKKPHAVEHLAQISLLAQSLAESVSAPVVSRHYSTSVSIATPSGFMPKISSDSILTSVSPSISSDHHKKGNLNVEQGAIDLKDFSKVEEVKLKAGEAAAQAAAAVNHYQDVWSLLDKQKNFGLMSDAEATLSSAAVAVATAASVAKVAAAAAKIASDAAVQAKQMADDAVTKYRTDSSMENDTIYPPRYVTNSGNANLTSILKGQDRNEGYNSIISAAKEASRKRVEAASAATRHAQNLDDVVKAAELAADAVSQAVKIISIGSPSPLTELAEAGPDYWKLLQLSSLQVLERDTSKDKSNSNNNVEKGLNVFKNQGLDRETRVKTLHRSPVQRPLRRNLGNQNMVNSTIASYQYGEKTSKAQEKHRASDSSKINDSIARSNTESRSKSLIHDAYDITASLREGSLIEVRKDQGNLKGAWFSANVLSLKDGEALVCYTTLQSDGSEQLKEWVSLQVEGSKAPIIRIPHPMTVIQLERTRKRLRASAKDYNWSIGDRVDAWIEDSWHEGVIAEKYEKDEATFSVHFPAQREITVKGWQLRPTLIWSNGQWTEWSRTVQDCSSKKFMEVNPGKKQKFMEVSKHFVSDRSTKYVPNDIVKLVKSEQLNKGKLALASGKSLKNAATDKIISEAAVRRSNRRIQPTTRLLEGLESSLTKGRRSHN